MAEPGQTKERLDLSAMPPIHILPAHLLIEDLHEYEDQVFAAHGKLTYDPREAKVFLARISQKKRAAFELRSKGIWTEEDTTFPGRGSVKCDDHDNDNNINSRKRRRSMSEDSASAHLFTSKYDVWPDLSSHVLVIKIEWLETCLQQKRVVSYQPHVIYYGKVIPSVEAFSSKESESPITYIKATPTSTASTLSRGEIGPGTTTPAALLSRASRNLLTSRQSGVNKPPIRAHKAATYNSQSQKSKYSYNDDSRSASPSSAVAQLPPLPSWATGPYAIYSCCRSTPMEGPNKGFIGQLANIKEIRILTLDPVGVRAYSTAIASISAYPHRVKSWTEVVRLPGCNERIANLWQDWHDSVVSSSPSSSSETETETADLERFIPEVRRLQADRDLQVLHELYNIWGVGAETARRFYFVQGWKDLDDIVECGWQSLSRVQQIGVKYYDEFQLPIGRVESESIAATIKQYAQKALSDLSNFSDSFKRGGGDDEENEIQAILVGGYRRGKPTSADVDVILTHRNESLTKNLIIAVVRALEDAGFITHTLVLHTSTSDRGQATLPFRSSRGRTSTGISSSTAGASTLLVPGTNNNTPSDSLDKALCVWKDPDPGPGPNSHRRVDIIISPWRTIGCAVLAWSGGTTFQRDLRRFAKKERGWKFDSSGIREIPGSGAGSTCGSGAGKVVDLEQPWPRSGEPSGKLALEIENDDWKWEDTWQSRERRVMEGLGIGWRPPEERCTG